MRMPSIIVCAITAALKNALSQMSQHKIKRKD